MFDIVCLLEYVCLNVCVYSMYVYVFITDGLLMCVCVQLCVLDVD